MNEFLPTIIGVLSGAAAANLAGLAFRKFSLGYVMNTVVGVIAGAATTIAVNSTGVSGNAAVLNGVIWGGIGGGVLLLIAGVIRNVVKK